MINPKTRNLIIVISILLIASITAGLIYQGRYSATLDIEVTPSISVIKINGRVRGQGNIKVKPGDYYVTAEAKGFAGSSQKITVTKKQPGYVGMVLLSNSADTLNWYSTHPDDRKKAEGISSKNFDVGSKKQVDSNPFILKLPFIAPGDEFKIDYSAPTATSGGKAVIYIQALSDEAKADALLWIKGQGFDPKSLYIIYTGS